MLSKSKSKFIISLQKKKIRDEEKLYVIEGDKIVREYLAAGIPLRLLAAKPEFIRSLNPALLKQVQEVEEVSYEDLRHLSTLKTPHNALAVVPVTGKEFSAADVFVDLCCALESVQDPGNLGTIIRAAGWFGIRNIICSPDCVDIYNPRVVQASMGSIIHVNVFYSDLGDLLKVAHKMYVPVFGALLEGDPVYEHPLDDRGIIVLGNESKGISSSLIPYITSKIMIPRFGTESPGLNSLNIGMAASVIFSEFKRRHY